MDVEGMEVEVEVVGMAAEAVCVVAASQLKVSVWPSSGSSTGLPGSNVRPSCKQGKKKK